MTESSRTIVGQPTAAGPGVYKAPRTILYGLGVLAALSLVGGAYAQTETTPGGPSAPTPSVTDSPTNPEMAGASTAAPRDSPPDVHDDVPPSATAGPGKIAAGMRVRSQSGDLLGNVASIVPAASNREGFVVIASPSGVATPVPYSEASAMVQNDTIVVNKSRFVRAPKVQESQGEDVTPATWEQRADRYWKSYIMSSERSGAVDR